MTRPSVVRRRANSELQLESVARVSKFPIVETGLHIANSVYERIKRSNSLMGWSLDTAEHSLAVATASAMPAIVALHLPIATIDHLLCRGIDIVEQRVPAVHLPPHLMYWNTREFVNNKFVKPVLIRADSVKQIGSQAANAAVERLNGAIDVADQYVDRYLPPDPADSPCTDCTDSGATAKLTAEDTGSKAARTIEHGARFSRKLQRRLTRRTFAEARALKEQGTECIHVLLYVVELLATDPKLAMQKARELWTSLSGPEPENQARPSNLEQLLVLFTRETARRVVHLVNAVAGLAARTPRRLGRAILRLSHRLVLVSEQALKVTNELLYRLLANVLVLSSSLGFPALPAQLCSGGGGDGSHGEKRKCNGYSAPCVPGDVVAAAVAGAGENGVTGGPGYLSLVAKINIVPLPRPSVNASIIEELEEELEEEEKELEQEPEDVRRVNGGHHLLPSANNNHHYLRPPVDRSKKFAYNGDSMLPLKAQRPSSNKPLLTTVKPKH